MQSRTFDELALGDSATFSKTITETDVAFFAAISGDFNPVHVDAVFAASTPFGARVAHGPITLALSAGILGTELPGVGTIAVSNRIDYRRPVYIGDTITTHAEIAELEPERRRVTVALRWTNQDDELVADGAAIVKPPKTPAI